MRTALWLFASCLVAAVAPDARAADLVIRERTTIEGPKPRTFEATQYYGERKLATDGPRQRTFIDLEARTMTALDKAAKAYTVTTFDEVSKQTDAARKMFERLPPETQKQQLASEVKVTTKATRRTEEIAGYPAKEYAIDAGPMQGSVWLTERLDPPRAKREWDKVAPSLRGVTRLSDRVSDAVAGLKGVVLRKTVTQPGKDGGAPTREVTEALSVRTEAAPAEMFGVPDGFTKWTVPNVGR